MRLIAASTNISSIYTVIQKEIDNKNMAYGGLDGIEALELYNQELKDGEIDFNKLDYGFVKIENNL